MKLHISASDDNEFFIIRPLDFHLDDFPRLPIYIKSINNGYREGEKVLVPLGDADTDSIFARIKKLLEGRLKFELEYDEESSMLIEAAKLESAKFADFSSKALRIRNDDIDKEDLQKFVALLKRNSFKRELLPFQLLAAYHLAFAQNACNFSVPGSGKTTTVLAAYEYLKNADDVRKRVNKLLVVGPLAAFIAWKDDFEACYGYEPKVLEIMGGVSRRVIEDTLLRSEIEEDIIIASYGSIAGKKDILQKFLNNNPSMVVLDEAHRIKNVEDGIQSYAALSLSPHAKSRVILTGTPAANSYIDLYNLYKFIWPANDIVGYSIPQLGNMSKSKNDARVPDLINRISPFFIRVKKSDLSLPNPVFHPPTLIEMAPIQQRIYDNIASMAVKTLEDNSLSAIFKRSALIRLRQASTNPNLLNKPLDDYYDSLEGDYVKKTPLDDSVTVSDEVHKLIKEYHKLEVPNKFMEARNLAESIIADGGKLLIWCEFVGTCNDLSSFMTQSGIANRILYGGTQKEERENIIRAFHEDNSEFRVIIANPHAVGESISLHKACHNALYLEMGYNAGTYMQSKDRIHRVGLSKSDITNYYFFQSGGSVDGSIYERVKKKEARMLEIIEKEEIPLLANNTDFWEDTEDDIKTVIREYYEFRRKDGI